MKTLYVLKMGKSGLVRKRKSDAGPYVKGMVELRQRLDELNARSQGGLQYQLDYVGGKPLDILE